MLFEIRKHPVIAPCDPSFEEEGGDGELEIRGQTSKASESNLEQGFKISQIMSVKRE